MNRENYMEVKFKAISQNEKFARTVISAFCLALDPSVSVLNDIKTVVSEAVTNCILHAYNKQMSGDVVLCADIDKNDVLTIKVTDFGVGITDINQATQPFYTTKPQAEHSGMGFTIMQTFMDSLKVWSSLGKGTTVELKKNFGAKKIATEA